MRVALVLTALALPGCAANRAISGQVVDRNGQPVPQALVSVDPGNVELLTDAAGRFEVGYLRTEDGDRRALSPRTTYTVEAFKVGFHLADQSVPYKKGRLELAPLELRPDTLRLQAPAQTLDPAAHERAVRSAGATYEGE